jgi:signal transduction histidine kinase
MYGEDILAKDCWIKKFIEDEIASRALEIESSVNTSELENIALEQKKQTIVKANSIIADIRSIMNTFGHYSQIKKALKGSLLPDEFVAQRYNQLNALLLFGHDLDETELILKHSLDFDEMGEAFSITRHFVSTILTMAWLVSEDKKYLREVKVKNITDFLQTKSSSYHEMISIKGDDACTISNYHYTALYNLVKNSINANSSHITIGIDKQHYYVKDDGRGIPKEKIGSLFYPCYGNSTNVDSCRLGLKIVKRVTALNNTYVTIESTVEGGHTYIYNTKMLQVCETEQKPRGTTVSLCFP